jgi:hypothetical protein
MKIRICRKNQPPLVIDCPDLWIKMQENEWVVGIGEKTPITLARIAAGDSIDLLKS